MTTEASEDEKLLSRLGVSLEAIATAKESENLEAASVAAANFQEDLLALATSFKARNGI